MTLARTKANVRPINPFPGNIINDVAYHGTIEAGMVVYHDGTGWAPALVSSGACDGKLLGIALHDGSSGDTGKDVLVFGRVTGWTGMDDGKAVWTAAGGEVNDQASPQYSIRCGFSLNDTDIFFFGALDMADAS